VTIAAATFVSGMITAFYLVAALFFVRFWRVSADRLFMMFAGGFAVLAVQRLLLLVVVTSTERVAVLVYGLRLLGFAIILWGVVDKNRAGG
jgi:hypothetical protein